MKAHGQAIARGDYREKSSAMVPLCLASVKWRKLHQAQMDYRKNPHQPSRLDNYTLREELACEQIVRLIEYLQHIGCKDIEGGIRQIIDRDLK